MIVTRGIGRSAVKAAIVAAGLCIGSFAPPTPPIDAYIAHAGAEIRIMEVVVEDRTIELAAEIRVLVVTETARLASVVAEDRTVVVEV